jgi:DNA-binding transcriptional regulator YiaG
MNTEIWKPAVGLEQFYEASNLGNIRRLRGKRTLSRGHLIGIPNNIGYLRVCLHVEGGKQINGSVHRIIAKTFVPNPENKPEVNHKNGVKADNRAKNLEWATRSENETHAYENGMAKAGSGHGNSKVTELQVVEIRSLRESGVKLRELSRLFDLSESTLSTICRRQGWRRVP